MVKRVRICFTAGIAMGMILLSGCSNSGEETVSSPVAAVSSTASETSLPETTAHTEIVIPKSGTEAPAAPAASAAETKTPTKEMASAGPEQTTAAEREKKTVKAYILETGEDTIYVDLENPAERAYDGEGEERKVAFDVGTAAFIDPAHGSVGESVEITYYEEEGKKIATKVTGDGVKREAPKASSEEKHTVYGTFQGYEGDKMILEGDDGETYFFVTEELELPADLAADDYVEAVYRKDSPERYVLGALEILEKAS